MTKNYFLTMAKLGQETQSGISTVCAIYSFISYKDEDVTT